MTKPAETEPCEPKAAHQNPQGLHDGWTAARLGEPFDRTQSAAWREGHRLWFWAHPAVGQTPWLKH